MMEISQHWRLKKARYSLVGSECPHCGHKAFPAREVCPACGVHQSEVTTAPVPARRLRLASEGVLDRASR